MLALARALTAWDLRVGGSRAGRQCNPDVGVRVNGGGGPDSPEVGSFRRPQGRYERLLTDAALLRLRYGHRLCRTNAAVKGHNVQPSLLPDRVGLTTSSAAVSRAHFLSDCEREQIHIPGAIQPHGAVIACKARAPWLITHASANLAGILGCEPADALGRPLQAILGDAACQQLTADDATEGAPLGRLTLISGPAGSDILVRAHRNNKTICVDIEPTMSASERPLLTMAQSIVETFRSASTCTQLLELAVIGLRGLVRCDRVLAYRFDARGDGQVVAEDCNAEVEPYLGQRYPAGDIPSQARRQYLLQRVGSVSDSSYVPVPLISDATLDGGVPLDLTFSALRSVSPLHREYMRNMGIQASLTIALTDRDALLGMLVCHHGVSLVAGPKLRAAAGMVGQMTSLMLMTLGKSELLQEHLQRTTNLNALIRCLDDPTLLLPQAMAAAQLELLELVHAKGAAIRLSGSTTCLGAMPPTPVVEGHLDALLATAAGEAIAFDDVPQRYPGMSAHAPTCSGALVLPLGRNAGDVIVWFRPETAYSVTWAGDPALHGKSKSGLIKPRRSFSGWTEIVTGRSMAWSRLDIALAKELSRALDTVSAIHVKAQLVELREHYQSLNDTLESKVEERTQALEVESRKRHKAEATLLQAQKMDAIGQLTGGVAHDFNNILTAVIGNLELARGQSVTGDTRNECIRRAERAARRGALLTDHLLSFARKHPLNLQSTDLNALIRTFEELILQAVGAPISVRLDLTERPWNVLVDINQFEMALLNLAVNARDAMPAGGILVIATSTVNLEESGPPDDLNGGDYTCVSITDSGEGMPQEVLDKVFEPFFTTKPVGKGTGLGLSQVYGFSKQAGGTTTVSSVVGTGTCVTITLPRSLLTTSSISRPAAQANTDIAVMKAVQARILVVDDEPDVLYITVEVLRSFGHDVVFAAGATQGLEILESDLSVGLVATDYSMPGMNGLEFIRQINSLRPEIPCLLITGYADIDEIAQATSRGTCVLRKPYQMGDLAKSVEKMLEAAA